MNKHVLWSKEIEKKFFEEKLKNVSIDDLFYLSEDGNHYAYWPKGYKGSKTTIQSRNSYVGKFTESFVCNLFSDFAIENGYFAVSDVVCNKIGLPNRSPADVAFCKTNSKFQKPEDIIAIFEVKMSIVWNWKYENGEVICIGDYKSHQGTPSLLRSDSMLKAMGKAINIRISDPKAYSIPIFIIGNTPITQHYFAKVDNLKTAGIIQGFWSLNPNPINTLLNPMTSTNKKGFQTISSYDKLSNKLKNMLEQELEFFSSMMSKPELGRIIKLANQENDESRIAERFLQLLWS